MNNSPVQKRDLFLNKWVIGVSVCITFFMAGYLFVRAQSFFPPPKAAPDNTGVNVLTGLTGYLRVNETGEQIVVSPLNTGVGGKAMTLLNSAGQNAALIGSAEATTLPALSALFGSSKSAAVYGYADQSGVSAALTSTIIDNPGHEVGEYISMVIGSDGLPFFAYYDDQDPNEHLRVAHCKDRMCSILPVEITDIDVTSPDAGKYTSVAVGSDGFPVISYYEQTASGGNVKVVHCKNVSCTSFDTPQILDSGTNAETGRNTSIAIAKDGYPIVSYTYDDSPVSLRVVHCRDETCKTSTNDSPVEIDTGSTGKSSSIKVTSTGIPVIAYRRNSGDTLKYAICNDYCTSNTKVTFGANLALLDVTLALTSDDKPVISSVYGNKLYISTCATTDCSSGKNTIEVASVAEDAWVAVGDDFPIVAYDSVLGDTTHDVTYIRCRNLDCSTREVARVLDGAGESGEHITLAVGNDGFPIMGYYDDVNNAAKVTHCTNLSCTSEGSVGAYGYVTDLGGVALVASTTAGGSAGVFVGAVDVDNGDLYVENMTTAPHVVITSSDSTTDALIITNAVDVSGGFETGIMGGSAAWYGVYAYGEVSIGLYAVNTVDANYDGGSFGAAHGVVGISSGAAGTSGVYGSVYSSGASNIRSNGVEAVVGSASNYAAAEGNGITGGGSSIGVYGNGGAFSGYFDGNVSVGNSINLSGEYLLTEAYIQSLVEWCGPAYCPDPFQ